MVELKSDISTVGEYDAYIVEIRSDIGLDDEITGVLDRNLGTIADSLGDGAVYVRPVDGFDVERFLQRLDADLDLAEGPFLVLLDEHPAEATQCLVHRLGELDTGPEARRVLEQTIRLVNDEEFMVELTWPERLEKVKRVCYPRVGQAASTVAFIASVAPYVP